jgi:hypothetical protein
LLHCQLSVIRPPSRPPKEWHPPDKCHTKHLLHACRAPLLRLLLKCKPSAPKLGRP